MSALPWIIAALSTALAIINGFIAARWQREAQHSKVQFLNLQAVRQAEINQAYLRRSAASRKGWQAKATRINLPLDTPPATT
jgi:hypothetical protein